MIIAVGMDVHKDKCAACARFAGKGEPKPKHEEFLKNFNREFRRFDSDYRGMTAFADALRDHEVHVLIENSTKSHDVYWMLRNLGIDVIVAHASDLKRITESQTKNDDNDAFELAGYMRRRLWGEIEFAESHIPEPETLLRREVCRFDLNLRSELSALKRQIRSHMLIRGWKLTRDYKDVVCASALRELRHSGIDIFLYDVAKAEYLKKLIFETERNIRFRMEGDPLFDGVWSIPGFGVLSAAYFSCMIDDISRFPDGKSFSAHLGLTPKLDESADKGKNCGMSRRGDPNMRRLIAQATFVHIFHTESFISRKYQRLKSRGKKHSEALVACANSMAKLVFAILRDGSKYAAAPEVLARARALADSDEVEDEMEAVGSR